MRYARVLHAGRIEHVVLESERTGTVLSAAPWEGGTPTATKLELEPQSLRAPVTPTKVLCVGRNYAAHAAELGNTVPKAPLLFLKPPSSVVGPGDVVWLPPESQRVEHEAELAVVIGKRATRITREQAMDHVLGYTVACDVTARDIQRSDVQFTRGKGFDTFCPTGPHIETQVDPSSLSITCRVRGDVRQDGNTSQMVFDVPTIVAYASCAMTLEPGDLLLTGTPEGVGPLVDGDDVTITIDHVGSLSFTVQALDG